MPYDSPMGDPPTSDLHTDTGKLTSKDGRGRGSTESRDDDLDSSSMRDSGYAWVIALSGFLAFAIYGAFMRSEGIYYVMFISRYKASAQTTAWLGAVASTLQSFSAPVATMLINRFSVRTAVILGSFLSALGYVASAYTTSIYWLFFTYSVLQGLARSLVLTPAFVCASMYFERRRGQVLAFVTSGAGFGALVIMPVTQWLEDTYQFQGAFLLLGGVALNGLVCALLFRPYSLHQKFNLDGRKQTKEYDSMKNTEQSDVKSRSTLKLRNQNLALTDENKNLSKPALSTNGYFSIQSEDEKKNFEQCKNFRQNAKNFIEAHDCNANYDERSEYTPLRGETKKNGYTQLTSGLFTAQNLDFADIQNLEEHESEGSLKSMKEKLEKSTRCCLDIFSTCFAVDSYDKSHETKSKVFHVSIFRHAPFVTICFSVVFYKLGNKTFLDFIPAASLEQGLTDSQLSLLLSLVQTSDMAGKMALGYAMDTAMLRPYQEIGYILMLFLLAGLSLAVPILHTFKQFCVMGGLYGVFSGASTIQRTLVVAKMVDADVLSSCFGVLYGFQGLGTLVGPPMAGALKDVYGDYKWTYVFTGSSLAVSGCLVAICLIIVAARRSNTSDPETDSESDRVPQCCCSCVTFDLSLWAKASRLFAHARCFRFAEEGESMRTPLINNETPIREIKNGDKRLDNDDRSPLMSKDSQKDTK